MAVGIVPTSPALARTLLRARVSLVDYNASTHSVWRLVSCHKVLGSVPARPLSLKSLNGAVRALRHAEAETHSSSKRVSWPTALEIVPTRLLTLKYLSKGGENGGLAHARATHRDCSAVSCHKALGIVPDRPFLVKTRNWSAVNWPIVLGMVPDTLLLVRTLRNRRQKTIRRRSETHRYCSAVSKPNALGNVPENLLPLRNSCRRAVSEPRALGMVPVRPLSSSRRAVMAVSAPTPLGSVPVSPSPTRSLSQNREQKDREDQTRTAATRRSRCTPRQHGTVQSPRSGGTPSRCNLVAKSEKKKRTKKIVVAPVAS